MNRETKRLMQRQGALGPDGGPAPSGAAGQRPPRGPRGQGGPERPPLPQRSVDYIREVRSEMQKVAWPGRAEVANYTLVVFVAVVLLTAFVFGLDYGFAKAVIYLFR